MAMLPHEKALVERLKDKPFALLGMNSDGDAAKVRQIVADHGIAWRQAVLGSGGGAIARRWQVQSWPTIYVLDHKGVIRFKDVRGAAMEAAVDKLLAELESEKAK
ncbi:MAG: TlpA family protein disulfide reductase [Planctomycetota bacterium]|nr:MAG: TlpA family protein disulfide reductase [Planctomycetota bacterium]